MENIADKAFVQKKLKPFFVSYILALAVFLLVLSCAVLFNRYASTLGETLDKLYILKINFIKVKNTIEDIKGTLRDSGQLIPPGRSKGTSATYMYSGLDTLRSYVGKAHVTVAAIEDKGNELRMPLTITGAVADYPVFLNSVGRLQSMRFPFFAITNLTMAKNITTAGGAAVSFEIQGVLSTPKLEPDAGQNGTARRNN
jgi:hypothetical protein